MDLTQKILCVSLSLTLFTTYCHHLQSWQIDAVDSYILLLEAAFSYILWTMRTVNKDHGMSSMYL
jgi:hypothetical protein